MIQLPDMSFMIWCKRNFSLQQFLKAINIFNIWIKFGEEYMVAFLIVGKAGFESRFSNINVEEQESRYASQPFSTMRFKKKKKRQTKKFI